MGAVLDLTAESAPLAEAVELEPEPPPEVTAALVPAVPDALNQGNAPEVADRQHLAMFVDDDIIAAIREHMRKALGAAVASAYLCFGGPDQYCHGDCLAPSKFETTASHRVLFVGYIIDTRSMRVIWPDDKVQALKAMLHDWLHHTKPRTPLQIAKLLGFCLFGYNGR